MDFIKLGAENSLEIVHGSVRLQSQMGWLDDTTVRTKGMDEWSHRARSQIEFVDRICEPVES